MWKEKVKEEMVSIAADMAADLLGDLEGAGEIAGMGAETAEGLEAASTAEAEAAARADAREVINAMKNPAVRQQLMATARQGASKWVRNHAGQLVRAGAGTLAAGGVGAGIDEAIEQARDKGRQMLSHLPTSAQNPTARARMAAQNPMIRTHVISDGAALLANQVPEMQNIVRQSPALSQTNSGHSSTRQSATRSTRPRQKTVGDNFWDDVANAFDPMVNWMNDKIYAPMANAIGGESTADKIGGPIMKTIPGIPKAAIPSGPAPPKQKILQPVVVVEGNHPTQKTVGDAPPGLKHGQVGKTIFNQSTLIRRPVATNVAPNQEIAAMPNNNFYGTNMLGADYRNMQNLFDTPGIAEGSGINKVVGDAAPTRGMKRRAIKTVGDAPPGDIMTEEEVETAATLAHASTLLTLQMLLVQKSQLLNCQNYFDTGLSDVNMRIAVTNEYGQKQAVWNQSPIRYNCSLPMAALNPTVVPFWDVGPADVDFSQGFLAIIEYERYALAISTPLAGNVTYAALSPLLHGAPLTDFASALRVKVILTEVDALVNAMEMTKLSFEAQTSYSFVIPLSKLLLYLGQIYYIQGQEMNEFVSGMQYWAPHAAWGVHDRRFPLGAINDTVANLPNANLAWITYKEMVDKLLNITNIGDRWGNNVNWAPEFDPENWGNSCAVVFVRIDELNRVPDRLSARILSQLDYPYYIRNCDADWARLQADNAWDDAGQHGTVFPRAGLGHIPGPTDVVLFIVVNMSIIRPGQTLSFGATGHVQQLAAGNTPAAPLIGAQLWLALEAFITHGDGPVALINEVRRWESTYGNNSDRDSALRVVAHQMYARGQPKYFSEALDNQYDEFMGYRVCTDPADTPFEGGCEENSDEEANRNVMRDNTETPLGWRISARNAVDVDMNNATQDACIKLGQQDLMISFMVERKWLLTAEESAEQRLSDPTRIFATVREMAEIMLAESTIIRQLASISYFDVLQYGDTAVAPAEKLTSELGYRNKYFEAAAAILIEGIQYPSAFIDFETQQPYDTLDVIGNDDWEAGRLVVIPWTGMSEISYAKYVGAPILAATRVSLRSETFRSGLIVDPDTQNDIIVDSVLPDQSPVGVSALEGLRLLTKAYLPTGVALNPKWILFNTTTANTKRWFVAFNPPDMDIATMKAYDLDVVLYSVFATPVIHYVLVRNWSEGAQNYRYGVNGMRETFLTQTGSVNFGLFVSLADAKSTEVSPYYGGHGREDFFRVLTFADAAAITL